MFYTSAHIQECKDRKSKWRGVLKYKDPATGLWKERKRTFTGVVRRCDAEVELQRWHLRMENEARYAGLHKPQSDKTVYRAVADLLDFQLALHRISIATFQTMKRSNDMVIGPRIGMQAFMDMTRDDMQEFVNDLSNQYAPASVRTHFAVVSKAYKDALRRGELVRDPTDGVVLPKQERRQINYLDEAGRLVFLAKMGVDSSFYLPAMIAYFTGMRAGEICALQWRNVKFDEGVLKVRRSAVFCEGPAGGDVAITVPKTPKSRRTIPLTRQLEKILQLERAGRCCCEDDFVVAQRNPKLLCSGFLKWSARNEVLGAAGTPISMHGLRHTFATLGVQSGMDIKSLSSMLGHASALMTLDVYASEDENAKRLAMEAFSEFLQREGIGG